MTERISKRYVDPWGDDDDDKLDSSESPIEIASKLVDYIFEFGQKDPKSIIEKTNNLIENNPCDLGEILALAARQAGNHVENGYNVDYLLIAQALSQAMMSLEEDPILKLWRELNLVNVEVDENEYRIENVSGQTGMSALLQMVKAIVILRRLFVKNKDKVNSVTIELRSLEIRYITDFLELRNAISSLRRCVRVHGNSCTVTVNKKRGSFHQVVE